MDQKAHFMRYWKQEADATRKVLSRIPEGSDYRPDPKSRTAREIAWQIVREEIVLGDGLEKGAVDDERGDGRLRQASRHGYEEARKRGYQAVGWSGAVHVRRKAGDDPAGQRQCVGIPARHHSSSRPALDLPAAD